MDRSEYKSQIFLDIKKVRPTWFLYWYPIKEMEIDPDKPTEMNLYSDGGPLQKYDEAFKSESQSFEKKNNHLENDPNIRGWEGHCKYFNFQYL